LRARLIELSAQQFRVGVSFYQINLTAMIGTAARMKFVSRTLIALDDLKNSSAPTVESWKK
jgi:hypothetical protein